MKIENSHIWRKKNISLAVSAALAGFAAGNVGAQEIEEIVVTATKRAEPAQDVPIALQAVSGDSLRELRVDTFDKYVNYLPNVIHTGNGPGKKEIYIRGSATEQASVTVAPAQGSAPGVALYVDEQPVSFGSRNLDVYAVDLERIEVLSGPQGTLFGASSQSGNIRLITNKPNTDQFESGFDAKFGTTYEGADSSAVNAYVNLPLSEQVAVRVAVYSDVQGGWIDNIPTTYTPSGAVVDRNSRGFGPQMTGADSIMSVSNDRLVEEDWNDATYRGGRVGAGFQINDDWDLLVQHTAQTLTAEGTFLTNPELGGGEDDAAAFVPDYNRDEFGLTTWTLNGRLANLDLIYTGGNLSRQINSIIDYTHYNNGGGYITYYLCSGKYYDLTAPNNCFDPTKQYADDTRNRRTTHEFRVTTDPSRRFRVLAGAYFNNVETNHIGDFQYAGTEPTFRENTGNPNLTLGNATLPTPGVNTVGPRTPATVFFNDFTRTEEESAIFGEIAFDVSDSVTLAVSARAYDLTTQLQGASNFSFGCRYGIGGNAQETADGRCNGTNFSNDVSERLRLMGEYVATNDPNVILDARSPLGSRDLWRGGNNPENLPEMQQWLPACTTFSPDPRGMGCHNAETLLGIQKGHIDLAGLQPDGSLVEDDVILKASLEWAVGQDAMLFANFSQGYRPATQNRNAGQLAGNQSGVYQNYAVPAAAKTDTLTSYEVGVKSYLLDRSVRLNATLFSTRIEDLQISRFDPSNVAFLFFMENVGDAENTGLDVDFQWAASDALTFSGAFSLLDTELTRLSPQLEGIAVPVGSELPFASPFAGNLRVRYEVPTMGGLGYVTASVHHRGETVSGIIGSAEFMEDTLRLVTGGSSGFEIEEAGGTFGTVEIPDGAGGSRLPVSSRYVNPSATTVNLGFGLERDNWVAEVFIDNANNESAPTAQVAGYFTPQTLVQRPRTVGVRVSFDFE